MQLTMRLLLTCLTVWFIPEWNTKKHMCPKYIGDPWRYNCTCRCYIDRTAFATRNWQQLMYLPKKAFYRPVNRLHHRSCWCGGGTQIEFVTTIKYRSDAKMGLKVLKKTAPFYRYFGGGAKGVVYQMTCAICNVSRHPWKNLSVSLVDTQHYSKYY